MSQWLALGNEPRFAHLINGDGQNSVKDRILRTRRAAVLDLGCAEATDLFLLYHTFGILHLEGVDSDSEERIVALKNKHHKTAYSSRYELLTDKWKPDESDVIRARLTREQYSQFFKITQAQVQHYAFMEDSYDVIIACHLLHYLSRQEAASLVQRILTHVSSTGVYYIRIRRTPSVQVKWSSDFSYEACQVMCRELLHGSGNVEFIHAPHTDESGKSWDEETVWTNL